MGPRTIHPPLIVGHEFVGEIVEVGSNVTDFHPGDIVSGEGHVVCGRCRHCLAGRRHLCANAIGLGVGRDGAFAEYVVLPMTNVWHHWPGIHEDVAAIFDPFGNAVHTALAFQVLGEDVLVVGAGPIGLMATAVARHAGARYVVVSEPNAYRRELATRMGATPVVDPRERTSRTSRPSWAWSRASTSSSRCPATGRDPRRARQHGPRRGMAILGIPTEEIPIDLNPGRVQDADAQGIYGREMYETWYKMSVMLQSGLDITPGDHPPVLVPRPRGGLRGRPVRRLRQGPWTGRLVSMTAPTNDPRWRSSPTSCGPQAHSTCTGRCGSCLSQQGPIVTSTDARRSRSRRTTTSG